MKLKFISLIFFLFCIQNLLSQNLDVLVPTNTATHIAIKNGSWFDNSTWSTNTIPSDAAIVHIPVNKKVTYQGQSNAHIFVIRVDGEFICSQTNINQTTTLKK